MHHVKSLQCISNVFFAKMYAQVISRKFILHLDDIKLYIIIGITLKYKLVLTSAKLIAKPFFEFCTTHISYPLTKRSLNVCNILQFHAHAVVLG